MKKINKTHAIFLTLTFLTMIFSKHYALFFFMFYYVIEYTTLIRKIIKSIDSFVNEKIFKLHIVKFKKENDKFVIGNLNIMQDLKIYKTTCMKNNGVIQIVVKEVTLKGFSYVGELNLTNKSFDKKILHRKTLSLLLLDV